MQIKMMQVTATLRNVPYQCYRLPVPCFLMIGAQALQEQLQHQHYLWTAAWEAVMLLQQPDQQTGAC